MVSKVRVFNLKFRPNISFCSSFSHSKAPDINSFLYFTFHNYSIFTKTMINIRLKSNGESEIVFVKVIYTCIK
jgi:hypothetical protein